MTTYAIEPYAEAVLAQLRDAPFSEADVFDSGIPRGVDRPQRYLLAFVGFDAVDARLAGAEANHDVTIILRGVGTTPREARAAADHGRSRLIGARLIVPGRASAIIRFAGSRVEPIGFDPDVGDGRWFHEDEFAWFTTPTTGGPDAPDA